MAFVEQGPLNCPFNLVKHLLVEGFPIELPGGQSIRRFAWPRTYVYEWLGVLIGFFYNELTAIENYFWTKNAFYPPSWAFMDDIREQYQVRFATRVHKLTLEDRNWFMGNALERILVTFPEVRRVNLELPTGGITGQHCGELINAEAGGFDLTDIDDIRQLESNHLIDAFEQILEFAPKLQKVKIIIVLPTLERIDSIFDNSGRG